MHLRPLNDTMVVKRNDADTKSPGGIIVPDAAQKKPTTGEVLSVGPGKRMGNGVHQAMDVRVGDTVMFDKYAGTELELGGEQYVLLSEKDIVGIVENN
jgi:chaperonin GroES